MHRLRSRVAPGHQPRRRAGGRIHPPGGRPALVPSCRPCHAGRRGRARGHGAASKSDHSGQEWFTPSHREFTREGRTGYSDFGPLPPTFKKVGGQAYAVVVHLTFVAEDGDVWVEHSVSDSIGRDDGNATSKIRGP